MLSLNLPVSIPKPQSLPNTKQHFPLFHSPNTATASQSRRFPSILAARADVAVEEKVEEETQVNYEFPEELDRETIPRHVAIIMDGNGRWAKQRGKAPGSGHQAGAQALRQVVKMCSEWGVKVLTVFAFSTDNWIRPEVEVDFLMNLFERILKTEIESFASDGIRISIIGDSSKLPKSLQRLINEVEESTKENSKLHLLVAVSYSGKYDVVQACRSIAQKAKDGLIQLEDIDESLIENELETNCAEYPYPDLLVRTSGELRISNFLLWQLAYTELFFSEALWPDFGRDEFIEALVSFQQRKRRFGARKW